MSDTTRDLYIRGMAAAKAGEKQEAAFFLEWLLRLDPPMEMRKDAWFWLGEISDDPAIKRSYLEEILSNDLWDSRARRALAILDGKLKHADIIDPNKVREQQGEEEKTASADRFTCPTCGGRRTYTPDGQSLTCEYCESQQRISGRAANQLQEDDFIIGLATAKGHLRPTQVNVIVCQGCGASFTLPPEQITKTCPYCQSAYVLNQKEVRELAIPNALIPFSVDVDRARQMLKDWFASQEFEERPKVARGIGLYVPIWCFDIGGTIQARYEIKHEREWVPFTDQQVVMRRNVLIPASARIPANFVQLLPSYDLKALAPYDQRYLANWMAETYQVTMADASLDARQQALEIEQERIRFQIETQYRDITFSSASMQVESYQLLLLPLWYSRYNLGGQMFNLLINGQNGKVAGELPEKRRAGWITRLIGE